MTQGDMAAHLILDQSMISRLENGEVQASYSLVRQWCAYTQGMDLMTMDLAGGMEGWKKLQKLEQMMRSMQEALATASMQRKSNDGKVSKDERFRSPGLRGVFSRLRS
jgi:transcriptional regulator with XRE-family HTH domain